MSTYRLAYVSDPGGTYLDLDGTPDANGALWYLLTLSGWHEPPDVKTAIVPRPLAHGSVRLASYYTHRTITIGGVCKAGTLAGAKTAKAVLRAYYATATLSSGLWLTETEGTDTLKAAFFTPEGATCRIDHPVSSSTFEWELTLVSLTPYKIDQDNYAHI